MDREQLKKKLEGLLEGDVLLDEINRIMYSTDASMYEVKPLAVVLPRNKEDVIKVVKFARDNHISIHPRGGGSSISGSSIGPGIILDFTKYMNSIIEIDVEEAFVTVEPGIVCGDLNRELMKLGYFFPPDPSSADFCTIGGMIGHNAKGARGVKYGNTLDYVLSLEVVLSNGEVIETRPVAMESKQFERLSNSSTLEGDIYRRMRRIIEKNKELLSKVPKIQKNSSGYRVERVVDNGSIDLSRIFVSSEGTLGVVTKAKLGIKKLPRYRAVILFYFYNTDTAGRAVGEILKFKPVAVEMMDKTYIELVRGAFKEFRDRLPKNFDALLLVEFEGDSPDYLERHVNETEKRVVKDLNLAFQAEKGFTPEEQDKIWEIRKVGYPLLTRVKGGKKMATAMDDATIDPYKLPEYIKGLRKISRKYKTSLVVFGHAGDGNFHVYPLLNLDRREDLNKFAKIVEENYELTIKLGGTLAGEHGDGFAKSQFLQMAYGELYEVFKEIKDIFDPENILNPDKKITKEKDLLLRNLRFGPDYRVEGEQIKTCLALDSKEFVEEIERCIGCGMCRIKPGITRMCPVFKATWNESDSTRGRVNLLRCLIAGRISEDLQFSKPFKDIMYSCVNCKMCSIGCPAGIDASKLIMELKGRYAEKEGLCFPYRLFARIDDFFKMGRPIAPLLNLAVGNRGLRYIMEKVTKLDRRRRFPSINKESLYQWHDKPEVKSWLAKGNHKVVYFSGIYANYNAPELGKMVLGVLKRNGCSVVIPDQGGSGISSIAYGELEKAKRQAEFNVASLSKYVEKGYKIVCASPSETLALKKEYLDLLGTHEAKLVSENTRDVMEFLLELNNIDALNTGFSRVSMSAFYYPPCHIIAQKIGFPTPELLGLIPGLKLDFLRSGCCGIAGSFGFSRDNYELSMRMGKDLFNEIKDLKAETIITECEACKMQIEHGAGVKVIHPIQIMSEAYGLSDSPEKDFYLPQ